MACAYSVVENIDNAFECIQKSASFGLQDQSMILKHPMLTFMRKHSGFELFYETGFKEYEV